VNKHFQAKLVKHKLAYYRNYLTDSNQILHSDKDQQILFMSDPATRKTNPRWWTAAILRNRKLAMISPQTFDRSARNLAWRRILAFRGGPAGKISNLKIQDGGR